MDSELKNYSMLFVVVNFGLGSKVIKIAKENGLPGGTVMLGMGTVKNRILEFLALADVRKEIVFIIAEQAQVKQAIKDLHSRLEFDRPNHGIAFTVPVANFLNDAGSKYLSEETRGVEDTMYKAIFVVVDRGSAEDVVDSSKSAGARGATIINARGSGVHETEMVFSMPIEPEKEIVMILAENEIAEKIVGTIRHDLNIDERGRGIIFILDVSETYGILPSKK